MDVQLIDVFGSDNRVCDAARVSFAKKADNYTEEQNAKLIKYLATHNHFSPFTHVIITMKEKVPIFVARQRFKHRIGFEYNEVSRRYVDDAPEFYIPTDWRQRPDGSIKQGSSDKLSEMNDAAKNYYEKYLKTASDLYRAMIDPKQGNIAPEQARMVLPQSMYTEYYVTGSLAAWARAYKLRIDPHAQKEIQDLAILWQKEIRQIEELKYSWEALTT